MPHQPFGWAMRSRATRPAAAALNAAELRVASWGWGLIR